MQVSKTFNILTIKIMKIFKFMTLALVAMLGFNSCSEDCDHEFIEIDHSADLVGTWTCLTADYAEALVIKADGSVVSTGVENGEYWDGVRGSIKTTNNKMTLLFEDNDNYEGRFEMICGEAFTIFDENGKHLTYRYCANDLADEIVGMWVCNDFTTNGENDMMIETFYENGKTTLTGFLPLLEDNAEQVLNNTTDYKVVGDLLFITIPAEKTGSDKPMYVADKLVYAPNGTAHGDILTLKTFVEVDNQVREATSSWLRIKQSLDLADQKYDYIKTFVTNVKGEDKDINFMGYTFNFAKMDGSGLDKMLKALLFAVEFPDADHLNYSYQMNGNKETYKADIEVEGNKMTIKMSEKVATLKDVVLYAFQDADCSQMHFYMHKTAFVNFYTNMQAMLMKATNEQFDINNAEAVNAIYNEINNAVETINVSLVMSK